MKKTLIIYESKYGYTEEVVKNMAMILGPSKFCKTQNFKGEYKDFDCFVFGGGIYGEKLDKKIYEFIEKNKEWLVTKRIALFCTCLNEKNGEEYLSPLKKILGNSVLCSKALPGKLSINKSNTNDIVQYAMEIKHKRDHIKVMPDEEIYKHIETFIKSHNTCDLATGVNKNIRSTPIEYTFKNGNLYFISEGGEKFANILLNSNVSISIYDSYEKMSNLAGMQISGKATIIPNNSNDYNDFMNFKKIEVGKLPIIMNLIKIEIREIEFLWSGFKSMGYDVKQYYGVI